MRADGISAVIGQRVAKDETRAEDETVDVAS